MLKLTDKDKILLHLSVYLHATPPYPRGISQEGIAKATGIVLPHIPRAARALCKDRLIEETKDYVEGVKRKRKVYMLTSEGAMKASELRARVKDISVVVNNKELKLGEVNDYLNTNFTPLQILLNLKDRNFEYRKLLRKRWVSFLDSAPRIRTFFNREEEIEKVNHWLESEKPSVGIIYGIAGIGKTALALQCLSKYRDKKHIFWYNCREYDTLENYAKELASFLALQEKPKLKGYVLREKKINLKEISRISVEDFADCFLVFDDFHKSPIAPQIISSWLDLLPKQDVKILITTRDLPSFYDRSWIVIKKEIQELELRGLSEKACLEWLRKEGLELSEEVFKTIYLLIRGHPLSLELMLMRRGDLAGYPSSVRKYMYEEILSKLTDEERRILQLSSLSSKPLPFESFNTEYETLEALVRRSLLVEVGNNYEIHEGLKSLVSSSIPREARKKYEKQLGAKR